MKSYTDIEQSKKLAEILSCESADMIYMPIMDIDSMSNSGFFDIPECYPFNEFKNSNAKPLPCWSLAALLSVLPIVYINNEKEVCGPLHIDITDSETPFVLWYVNPFHKGNIVELKTNEYNNLVDACVEMIIKLKDLNLL